MAISNEFLEAIHKKDMLGIRLMLKNSLIIDTSFCKYGEMIRCVNRAGIDIWMPPQQFERKSLEGKGKSWAVDLMNYELTAIMNDFSKEHMRYLQEIISYAYGTNSAQPRTTLVDAYKPALPNNKKRKNVDNGSISEALIDVTKDIASGAKEVIEKQVVVRDKKKAVIIKLSDMTKLLRNARIDKDIKLSRTDIDNIAWDDQLISELRAEALELAEICNYLQRGK